MASIWLDRSWIYRLPLHSLPHFQIESFRRKGLGNIRTLCDLDGRPDHHEYCSLHLANGDANVIEIIFLKEKFHGSKLSCRTHSKGGLG